MEKNKDLEIEKIYDVLAYSAKKSDLDLHAIIQRTFLDMVPTPKIEYLKIDFSRDDSYSDAIYKMLEEKDNT